MYDIPAYEKIYRRERFKYWAKALAFGIGGYLIFAFVLFPYGVCGCRFDGRRSSCQSNMKQLGLALAQYTQDSDGELPPIKPQSANGTWREALYPFVKATGVFRCPDNHDDPAKDSPENLPHSYGASISGWNKHPLASPFISVVDMDGYAGPEWNIVNPAFLPKTGRELHTHTPKHAFYQHPTGTINCLFTDGHVKSMPPLATIMPVNLWTRDNTLFTGQDLTNAKAILKHAEDE